MAGLADANDPSAQRAFRDALKLAVERLDGIEVLIEPINRRDIPGYFLASFDLAARDHRRIETSRRSSCNTTSTTASFCTATC